MQKFNFNLAVRLLGALLLITAPLATFAQKNKIVKDIFQAAPAAALEQKAAAQLPKTVLSTPYAGAPFCREAGSRQLQFRFAGEPVQLEIPFPSENLPADPRVSQAVQAKLNQLIAGGRKLSRPAIAASEAASAAAIRTLPSGESVRLLPLSARHFKRTHQLRATVNYFKMTTPKPVVLRVRRTREKVTVFLNDRLRYFSDVGQACPAGSFLLRYEDGRTAFFTPQQAPQSLKEAYHKAYHALHFPLAPQAVFFEGMSAPAIPEISRLAQVFVPGNPYADVYALPAHPVSGKPVQVAVLKKNVRLAGLDPLNPGTMAVAYPDGTFDVHPAGLVPPVLQEKIAAAQPLHSARKIYQDHNQLARDLHQSAQKGTPYASRVWGEVIAYEIPPQTYYQPEGRTGEFLNTQQKMVIYCPKQDQGQIVDKTVLNNPLFFTPLP